MEKNSIDTFFKYKRFFPLELTSIKSMKKKCLNCNLVNFADSEECVRCRSKLLEVSTVSNQKERKAPLYSKILKRTIIFFIVSFFSILAFYLSMIFTSDPLSFEDRQTVARAVSVLEEKGFSHEVFLLEYLTSFRRNDHWLNASVIKENAYAATNFPFEIMTVYPDFFQFSRDDTERAAILLHEAKHLEGKDEREAYKFVWENRKQLGWTRETHGSSPIWGAVRKQTREFAPELFVCVFNEFDDCTEN